jgi:hypothetical protein
MQMEESKENAKKELCMLSKWMRKCEFCV